MRLLNLPKLSRKLKNFLKNFKYKGGAHLTRTFIMTERDHIDPHRDYGDESKDDSFNPEMEGGNFYELPENYEVPYKIEPPNPLNTPDLHDPSNEVFFGPQEVDYTDEMMTEIDKWAGVVKAHQMAAKVVSRENLTTMDTRFLSWHSEVTDDGVGYFEINGMTPSHLLKLEQNREKVIRREYGDLGNDMIEDVLYQIFMEGKHDRNGTE